MFDSKIQLRAELPELGKYTVGEDFADIMLQEILKRQPRSIIEAGSGVSTVLAAYCLEQIGGGSLYSLEHDALYAQETKNMLTQHALTSVDVNVFFAPLCSYKIANETFHWYEKSYLDKVKEIDMLIVDGPPRATGKFARYPILPLFYDRLSSSAIILLDDANRPDEAAIVKR